MKHLPLKAVMTGLDIIETDEGYELHSPAGEAKYDAWGARREVNGIPEYFPSSISMKKRVPAATVDKGTENITLSGAATDVLYALFFRGALQSGDLPAKSGSAELRELGFAETRHTATEYQKENYFTFLTAEGQEFAIKHLADTRFGKPVDKQYYSAINIGVELDTTDAQKALDELDDKIRNSDAFKALNDIYQLPRMKISADQQVMNTMADALDEVCRRYFDVFGYPETGKTKAVSLAGRWVAIEGVYTLEEIRDAVEYIKRLRKQKADEKAMAGSSPYFVKDGQVFIKDAFIGNAIKTSVKLSPEMEKAISDAVSSELKKNLKPGGTIWTSLRRGF